jgi:hypothetical protein
MVNNRNQQTTCWASYQEKLQAKLHGFPGHFGTVKDTEIAADFLQQAIVSSYESNCPLWTTGGKRKVPCCSPQLGRLCQGTSKLLNKAKRTGVPSDWYPSRKLKGSTKGPLGTLSERDERSSIRVSMTYQAHGDSTKSFLKVPESDLGLFCFLLGNILPRERRH